MDTPTKLGRYEILETLGEGKQGRIYRARDPIFGEVALKVPVAFAAADRKQRERIREHLAVEARRQRELSASCASILPAYDVMVAEDGHVYLVQAYAEGGSLREVPRPVADEWQLADWGRQLCEALQTAHDASIYHRDVKPENVLRDRAGRLKLTDFGVAVEASRHRGDRHIVGTPPYIAPETWESNHVGASVDLFALGVLLYELATGQHPYDLASATTPEAIRRRVCEEDKLPIPARVVRGELSPELAAVLDRAVARDPTERHRSAAALGRDLQDHIDRLESRETQIVPGGPAPVPFRVRARRVWRRVRRRAGWPLVTAASIVLAVAVGVFFPRTVLPEPWIEEKIESFEAALQSGNAEQFVESIERNAANDMSASATDVARRMLDELGYYEDIALQKMAFDGIARTVDVRLVGHASALAGSPVTLGERRIEFEQTERGLLRWTDPEDWLLNPANEPRHISAVREMFVNQLWRPLQEGLAGGDADTLIALFEAPIDIDSLSDMMAWLHAYDRDIALPDWPNGVDPRTQRSFDWRLIFGSRPDEQIVRRITFAPQEASWKLTSPWPTDEPIEHVRWAVRQFMGRWKDALRGGSLGDMEAVLAVDGNRALTGMAQQSFEYSLSWLAETSRDQLQWVVDSVERPDRLAESAIVRSTVRCPLTPRIDRRGETETAVSLTTTFSRTTTGRWVPTEPADLAPPEPLVIAADRLLAPDGEFVGYVATVNQSAWPERVAFVGTDVDDVRIDSSNEVIVAALSGRYRFADGVSGRTQPLSVMVSVRRDGVRWTLDEPPVDAPLTFHPPTENDERVLARFDASVMSVLRRVFEDPETRFDGQAFEPLLPASAEAEDRLAWRNMFAWMKRHEHHVDVRLDDPTPLLESQSNNRVRVAITGRFATDEDDLGQETWRREFAFVENVRNESGRPTANVPVLQWSLVPSPGATLRDLVWSPPLLVRFASVVAQVEANPIVDVYERFLSTGVRDTIAHDMQRMRDWMSLGETQTRSTRIGSPRVVRGPGRDLHVSFPVRLEAHFGEQSARRDLELRFVEAATNGEHWQLVAPSSDDVNAIRERFIWSEPTTHAEWYVGTRLEAACDAYGRSDVAGYAQALTGSTESAEMFVDFLNEFGPDVYRLTVSSIRQPSDASGDRVDAVLALSRTDGTQDAQELRGEFHWQRNGWVAGRPADWSVDLRTARRVVRLIRAGLWKQARELFATLPADEQAIARPVMERIVMPAPWAESSSEQRDAATGLPQWFEDQAGARFIFAGKHRWPGDDGVYALYVQSREVSTARFETVWQDSILPTLQSNGRADLDRIEFWRTRDAAEVGDRLEGAVSGVTWNQARAFARQLDRDLPTEAEWLAATEVLDPHESRLIGGVWEWCRDAHGNETTERHVVRGGCWLHAHSDGGVSIDLREYHGSVPDDTIGFRTVIRIPSEPIR